MNRDKGRIVIIFDTELSPSSQPTGRALSYSLHFFYRVDLLSIVGS